MQGRPGVFPMAKTGSPTRRASKSPASRGEPACIGAASSRIARSSSRVGEQYLSCDFGTVCELHHRVSAAGNDVLGSGDVPGRLKEKPRAEKDAALNAHHGAAVGAVDVRGSHLFGCSFDAEERERQSKQARHAMHAEAFWLKAAPSAAQSFGAGRALNRTCFRYSLQRFPKRVLAAISVAGRSKTYRGGKVFVWSRLSALPIRGRGVVQDLQLFRNERQHPGVVNPPTREGTAK
jgi:hypothetical protein